MAGIVLVLAACASVPVAVPPPTAVFPNLAIVPSHTSSTAVGGGSDQAQAQCRPADLQLAIGERLPSRTGERILPLTLTNRATTPCFLDGHATVALIDESGRELPFTYLRSASRTVASGPPTRVDLPPGVGTRVIISKYRCDAETIGTARTVQLFLPTETVPLKATIPSTAVPIGYCGRYDPGSCVMVWLLAAPDEALQWSQWPPDCRKPAP
jgi:hypothetical protein